MRTIVIPDIHGCVKTFIRLLEQVALQTTDVLYLLGDYIDRGPGSKAVLETIMSLQGDGYAVRPIRGNHEQMLLDTICSDEYDRFLMWSANGGLATLKSYGTTNARCLPANHLNFLNKLPFYRSTDTHIFVHAGLDSSLEDPLAVEGSEAMLWTRQTLFSTKKTGGRQIVTGHTPVTLDEIRASIATPQIRLDNGCVFSHRSLGRLLALVLETGEILMQENIDTK